MPKGSYSLSLLFTNPYKPFFCLKVSILFFLPGDFRFILKWNELNAPLKRNVSQGDVGNSALYLLSDLGSAVTGEIQHVDCGYHTVGMVAVDEAEKVSDLLNEFSNK